MYKQLMAKLEAGEGFVVLRNAPDGPEPSVFDPAEANEPYWTAEGGHAAYMLEQSCQLVYALEHDEWRGSPRVVSLTVWRQIEADEADFWDRHYRALCNETVGAWNEDPWFPL